MTDHIPAEAVEAAAGVLSAELPDEPMWSCIVIARTALEAALPFLRPVPSRNEIADEVSGIQVGSGYYATLIGRDAALEAADAVLALFKGGEE